ncbi:hypothetical protein M407DRAFT_95923 [Tulasnella calospora MUT 4182]|uniref:Ketoreductase domain-containing protein n=1 Tax=Tulasnella calospora MUT 4182 TaxID=1051891 RepID=A0A0C3QVR4_9AGAM|nr:hypothetical protein M407DRAFT_95923 [Tulasnella calospora MUT 4182]
MASQPVVLVTGASKGIGFCIARILITRHGAAVVAFSRSRTVELEQLAREFPDTLTVVQGDVTSSQSISAAIKTAVDTYGHLDSMVLNAGTLGSIDRISSSNTSEWKDVFDINFFSLVELIQSALPSLRESKQKGKVIFVSSGAADRGYVGWGPYSASKAAMNSLCRTLANEEKEIISVSVRPGAVDTGMQATVRAEGINRMDPSELEKFNTLHSTGKLVKPEECGQVIAGLAVAAMPEMSGKYVSWDDETLRQFRE